jgi:integrase
MPLKILPPGTRKGNKTFLVRGMINGRRVECSAGKTLATARQLVRELTRKLEAEALAPGRAATFKHAADQYISYRSPSREDLRRIARVVALLGSRRVAELTQADIVDAARRQYPRAAAAATFNREIIRPVAAILHYAAENRLCAWLRIKPFKEPAPIHKAVDPEDVAALIEVAPAGPKRLLLVWLFCQGTRISDTLRVEWSNIDLAAGTVRLRVSKTDTWHTFPLHADVAAMLFPAGLGKLFPWRDRHAVYRWLRPLVQGARIPFTPHMARHTLGTRLAEGGAALRTIMDALGHADVHSSMRYQAPNLEVVRAELNRISPTSPQRKWGKIGGADRK